jgi:TMEM175 potassium channel family protein
MIGLNKRARPVPDEKAADGATEDERYTLGRLINVSDNVYAFSLTLLVVFLVVPNLPSAHTTGQLASALGDEWTSYLSYGLSFFTIYVSWTGHQRIFRYVRRCNTQLVRLNYGLLLFVALLPFPTAVLGRYGQDSISAVLYATTVSVIGLVMSAIWWYASRGRQLVRAGLDHETIRHQQLATLRAPAIFLLTIPLAIWKPQVAEFSWIVLWLGSTVLRLGRAQINKRS